MQYFYWACKFASTVMNVIVLLVSPFIFSAIMSRQWLQVDLHSTHLHWMPSVMIQGSSTAMISLVSYKSAHEHTQNTVHDSTCCKYYIVKIVPIWKDDTNNVIMKVNCHSEL